MPSSGVTGTLEIFGAKPNKTLLKISLGGIGEILEGFDGTIGWSLSPMTGPMLLEGKELEEKRSTPTSTASSTSPDATSR